MIRATLSLLSVGLLFLYGCATLELSFTEYGGAYKKAEERYKIGDFDGAVKNCIVSLSKKPNYEKASLLLKVVAPKAYEKHENKAKEYEQRADWDSAVTEYDLLLALAREVSSLRGSYPTVDVQGFTERRENAVQNAAEAHYKNGISLMNSEKYKEAVEEFKECQSFVPGYKDAESLYAESKAKALKRIAIMPFENRTAPPFEDIGALFTDHIISNLLTHNIEFVEFVTRDYLNQLIKERQLGEIGDIKNNPGEIGKLLGIYAFVFGEIFPLKVNYPPKTSKSYPRETTIYRSADEGGSYKVHATCTYYTRGCEVTAIASFRIIGVATDTMVKSDTVKASAVDEVKWAQYKGDERALTAEDKKLCVQGKKETEPEEILVNRAIEKLSDRLAMEVIDFFK